MLSTFRVCHFCLQPGKASRKVGEPLQTSNWLQLQPTSEQRPRTSPSRKQRNKQHVIQLAHPFINASPSSREGGRGTPLKRVGHTTLSSSNDVPGIRGPLWPQALSGFAIGALPALCVMARCSCKSTELHAPRVPFPRCLVNTVQYLPCGSGLPSRGCSGLAPV